MKLSIPTVLHKSSCVRACPVSNILETSAALRRTILFWLFLSSFEYHAEARSCSDLEGIKVNSLMSENETDLTLALARFIIGLEASMLAEESVTSVVLPAWCQRGSPLFLAARGKSTIKLLPSWQWWFTKSSVAIVIICENELCSDVSVLQLKKK